MTVAAVLVALAAQMGAPPPAPARVRARLDAATGVIEGEMEWEVRNTSRVPLDSAALHLYPRIFSTPNAALDDVNHAWVYARGFQAGGMALRGAPPGTAVHGASATVPLGGALAPGESRRVALGFRTVVPAKFGTFGRRGRHYYLDGGWHPYPAVLREDGSWDLDTQGAPWTWRLELDLCEPADVVVRGVACSAARRVEAGPEVARALSLVSAPLLVTAVRDGTWGRLETHWVRAPGARGARLLDRVGAALDWEHGRRPSHAPWRVVLAEAALRRRLIEPADGMGLFSDRLYQATGPLQRQHDPSVIALAFHQVLAPAVEAREDPRDSRWVAELVAWHETRRFLAWEEEDLKQVHGFLSVFTFIPAVDQLLHAPKFPFWQEYYDNPYVFDPFRESLADHAGTRTSGRVVVEKLRDRVGDDALRAVVESYLEGDRPMVDAAGAVTGRDLGPFFAQWTGPYPAVNYRLASVQAAPAEGAWDVEVRVAREGELAVGEPVDVRMRVPGEGTHYWRWEGEGAEGVWRSRQTRPPTRVDVDPADRLLETTRVDNGWPVRPKVLLNRFAVHMDLNGRDLEYNLGTSVVLDNDYSTVYTVDGFDEQEADGVRLGLSRAFGLAIDRTRYTYGVGVFGIFEALDPGFATSRSGRANDRGSVAGLSLVAGTDDRLYERDPTEGTSAGVFLEHFAPAFGSDFLYTRYGAEALHLVPLVRGHTLAGVARVSFTDGRAPTQRLGDLGGEGGVRGLRRGSSLGERAWSAGAEWRHLWCSDLDAHLAWLFWLRAIQGAAFVEAGNIDDRGAPLWNLDDLTSAAGYGLRVHGDYFGASPSVLRLEAARRLDEDSGADWLYYLGANQSF
ncbi:MAG: hypothetical protein HY722_07560 [Planctomycetes bacterium]|nr:hypothetical protein [Planctomycetota bacterium]